MQEGDQLIDFWIHDWFACMGEEVRVIVIMIVRSHDRAGGSQAWGGGGGGRVEEKSLKSPPRINYSPTRDRAQCLIFIPSSKRSSLTPGMPEVLPGDHHRHCHRCHHHFIDVVINTIFIITTNISTPIIHIIPSPPPSPSPPLPPPTPPLLPTSPSSLSSSSPWPCNYYYHYRHHHCRHHHYRCRRHHYHRGLTKIKLLACPYSNHNPRILRNSYWYK